MPVANPAALTFPHGHCVTALDSANLSTAILIVGIDEVARTPTAILDTEFALETSPAIVPGRGCDGYTQPHSNDHAAAERSMISSIRTGDFVVTIRQRHKTHGVFRGGVSSPHKLPAVIGPFQTATVR